MNIEKNVEDMLQRDDKIRALLLKHFEVESGETKTEAYKANAYFAAEVGVSLFNVIYGVRHPSANLTLRIAMDLAVNLNANTFWVNHGMALMPLLHMALQSQIDYATLAAEKTQTPNSTGMDPIMFQSKLAGLDLFVMLVYLMGGTTLASAHGLKLKEELEPYL